MTMRRVIHIATAGVPATHGMPMSSWTVVVCNDGTLWESVDNQTWRRLLAIPQEAVADAPTTRSQRLTDDSEAMSLVRELVAKGYTPSDFERAWWVANEDERDAMRETHGNPTGAHPEGMPAVDPDPDGEDDDDGA